MNWTIFTIPRAFEGQHGVIQCNSLGSWIRLEPRPEIVLFCDDIGVDEAAGEFGCVHVPQVQRSESGIPLIDGVFGTAQRMAQNDLMCFVNTDLVLLQDFMEALQFTVNRFPKGFLMVGARHDVPNYGKYPPKGLKHKHIDFRKGWQERYLAYVKREGGLRDTSGSDYFAFLRGLFDEVPPLAIGCTAWDNWLIWYAAQRVPVVNATQVARVVHHAHRGHRAKRTTSEYRVNQKLTRGKGQILSIRKTKWHLKWQNNKIVL